MASSNAARPAPARPGNGPQNASSLGSGDGSEVTPKAHVAQANIELIREDIVSTIGPMIATLETALAMAAIPDDTGPKYSLRCARAYWLSIAGSAAELVAAEAERQSTLLQGEGGHDR